MPVKGEKRAILDSLAVEQSFSAYCVEYNMDEIDQEILKYLQVKHPWATEDDYELTLDRIEKEHHFLQRIALTKLIEPESLSDECNICGEQETTNENFLVFCDGCNIAVHQGCYGIPNIPEGSWLCRPCLLAPKKTPSCILCPNPGGAFKRTSTGKWCHVICGILVPGARFENASLAEPIDIEDVQRSTHQCMACDTRKGGVVPCAYLGCRRYYHATCAVKREYYIDIGNFLLYCAEHDPRKRIGGHEFYMESPDLGYPTLENTPLIRSAVPLWMPQQRLYSAIEGIPLKMLHYSVNRIAYRDLKGRPGCTAFIKDMYAVWVAKRKHKPIIKRLRIDTPSEGFEGWGVYSPTKEVKFKEEDIRVLQEYSLPKEIVLPEKHQFHYNLLILTAYKLQSACKTLKHTDHQVKSQIIRIEGARVELLSKYVQGYTEINTLLDELDRTDKHSLFRDEITDEIAPGYSTVITHPQCLSVIKKRAEKLKYSALKDVITDLETLVANAYKYNGKDSFIGVEAQRIEEVLDKWKVQPNDIVLARIQPKPYLPYIITHTKVEQSKDSIRIQDILTKETHQVERERLVIPITSNIPQQLQQLNQITGVTLEHQTIQNRALQHLKKHSTYIN